jgi:hypothetical protein
MKKCGRATAQLPLSNRLAIIIAFVFPVLTTAQQLLSNCSATAQPHIIIGISAGVGKHSYFIA